MLLVEKKRPARAGLLMVELAGIEPATSWVRFTREASPGLAIVRRPRQRTGSRAGWSATVRAASSLLLDQRGIQTRWRVVFRSAAESAARRLLTAARLS